jgi:hypothetical protein
MASLIVGTAVLRHAFEAFGGGTHGTTRDVVLFTNGPYRLNLALQKNCERTARNICCIFPLGRRIADRQVGPVILDFFDWRWEKKTAAARPFVSTDVIIW